MVLIQTLLPDEILVIDDGSTDDTGEIAARFGAPVRVIRTANMKQAASRNFGVKQVSSEWIAFLDADDLWEPRKLERQMEELAKRPEADVCYTGRVKFTTEGDTIKLGKVVKVADPDRVREALYRNTNFLPSSVVIRRSAFLAVGGFDPHFVVVQDWDLWLRLLHNGTKFAACPEPLVRYRIHPGSVTLNNGMKALQAKNEIYRRHILPRLSPHTRWLRENQSQSEHEACAALILRDAGDSKYLSTMAKSILRSPFYGPHRYKVLAHMLYTSLKSKRQTFPNARH